MALYSSLTGFIGISDCRNATVPRGCAVSTWKYERAKLKTTDTSSASVSTASGRTPSAPCISGSTSGRTPPSSNRSRVTRYAHRLR
jgi:hypothetical protein